jgi:membrane protein DedA with SNARE-associated domain
VQGNGVLIIRDHGALALTDDRSEDPADPSSDRARSGRGTLPTPWDGPMQRADRIIVGGIAIAGLYSLVLLPLFPALSASHPALLELVRPSTASIVNMGARAGVGQTSFLLALLLGVPSLMMFDWLFWWAGKRWGDRVFVWLLGGDDERAARRLARLHRLERRFGPWAVVLAYFVPVPSTLIYAAVGDGGMRLGTFLVLDLLGSLLWASALATLGYNLGQSAVDVTDAIAHYSLWATLGLIALIVAAQALRGRRRVE